MNDVISPTSYFTSSVKLPGGLTVRLRKSSSNILFCLSLVDLSELDTNKDNDHNDNILATCLSSEEMALYANYAYEKRKREWLGGRLAAKVALLALSGSQFSVENFSTISVLPRENGSPVISSPSTFSGPIPSISISHSGNYAVGMAADAASCGIDIQQISEKTKRVADKFCTSDELVLLSNYAKNISKLEQLNLLCSAKEALKKSLLSDQPSIFQGVTLSSIDTQSDPFSLKLVYPDGLAEPATICALRLEGYMLAYTVAEQNHA